MPRPSNAGRRTIRLMPTSMQNADVDVWINGEKVFKSKLDDPKRELYNQTVPADFDGHIEVKIVVNSGTLVIGKNDAVGMYPVVYDNVPDGEQIEGAATFKQSHHVFWMQSPSHSPEGNADFRLEAGDSLEYIHLIPNGPEWLDVFFNRDKDRINFIENRDLNDKLAKYAMFVPHHDYFMVDEHVSPDERTGNLMKKIGAM